MAGQVVKTHYKVPRSEETIKREQAERVALNRRKREEQTPVTAKIRERAGSMLRTGLQNFSENYHRKNEPSIGDTLKRGLSNFGENVRESRAPKSRRSRDYSPVDTGLNIAMPEFGGIDMSLHPDPMYHGMGRKSHHEIKEHEGGRRRVVRTVTYYDD